MSQCRDEWIADAQCCIKMLETAPEQCEYWWKLAETTMSQEMLTYAELQTTRECVEALLAKDYEFLTFLWYNRLTEATNFPEAERAHNKLKTYLGKSQLSYSSLKTDETAVLALLNMHKH